MNEIRSIEMRREKDEQEPRFGGRMCGFATCSFTIWVLRERGNRCSMCPYTRFSRLRVSAGKTGSRSVTTYRRNILEK